MGSVNELNLISSGLFFIVSGFWGKPWVQYYNLDRSFDNTPFAYSLTTHKAQGSSIDHVFLATYDLRGCPDLQKIQYTAFTRAVNKVWIPLL